jgi:hypothetical protein
MAGNTRFRAANGRYAKREQFAWVEAPTGAFRPSLTVEPGRPDIPTLTDAVEPMPFWWRWWLFLSWQA